MGHAHGTGASSRASQQNLFGDSFRPAPALSQCPVIYTLSYSRATLCELRSGESICCTLHPVLLPLLPPSTVVQNGFFFCAREITGRMIPACIRRMVGSRLLPRNRDVACSENAAGRRNDSAEKSRYTRRRLECVDEILRSLRCECREE